MGSQQLGVVHAAFRQGAANRHRIGGAAANRDVDVNGYGDFPNILHGPGTAHTHSDVLGPYCRQTIVVAGARASFVYR
jgi:hypothetical protein